MLAIAAIFFVGYFVRTYFSVIRWIKSGDASGLIVIRLMTASEFDVSRVGKGKWVSYGDRRKCIWVPELAPARMLLGIAYVEKRDGRYSVTAGIDLFVLYFALSSFMALLLQSFGGPELLLGLVASLSLMFSEIFALAHRWKKLTSACK